MSASDCLGGREHFFDFKIVLITSFMLTKPRINPDSLILVIFNLDLVIMQHCRILHSATR